MEILAPAGGMESLKAAVAHGADAVYLGADTFSARAKAENFDGIKLKEAIDYAHLFGVRVYVTVNTLIKDSEMDAALKLIEKLKEYHADAVIIQDLGLIKRVRESFDIILHASTQMGVHNLDGALMAKELGLSRVVVSREASIKDIEKISKVIETEVFVQGALCVAFSGNCYFSSIVSGYSGNRGKCLQLCRKLYQSGNKKDYRLSTSDMMLALDIKRLKDAGVCSLKIEGRMRRPEYVAAAVDLYKNALKAKPLQNDIDAVRATYNRGNYNRSFYFEPTANVIYPLVQGHIGVKSGKIVSANKKIFVSDTPLRAGNGYKLLRNGRECGGALALKNGCECGYTGSAMPGDEIRLTTDKDLNKALLEKERKIPAKAEIFFTEQGTTLRVESNGVGVTVESDPMPIAQTASADSESVARILKRSGESAFELTDVRVDSDYPVFLVKSRLGELRRNALDSLSDKLIKDYEKRVGSFIGNYKRLEELVDPLNINGLVTQVESFDIPKSVYKKSEYIIINPTEYSLKALRGALDKEKLILNLPLVARDEETEILKEIIDLGIFDKFVVNNLYGLGLCKGRKVILGFGMNLINSAYDLLKINPFENDSLPNKAVPYIYAKPPLMTFCHCPKKTAGGSCKDCKGYSMALTDEKNEGFTVRRYKIKYCYAQLLPSKPLYFGNEGRGLIDLTGVPTKDCERVFNDAIIGEITLNRANLTRGLK